MELIAPLALIDAVPSEVLLIGSGDVLAALVTAGLLIATAALFGALPRARRRNTSLGLPRPAAVN